MTRRKQVRGLGLTSLARDEGKQVGRCVIEYGLAMDNLKAFP